MNLSTKYGCRKQTYDYCGDKGVVDWETGIDICTPTIYKIDNQQGPTVKHRHSTQYLVMAYMRKKKI